jgi:hypothetical protein
VEALASQLTWIEDSSVGESFPQDADLAAGDRHHDVRHEYHNDERREHQEDHHTRQMVLDKPPPFVSGCRRERPLIQ